MGSAQFAKYTGQNLTHFFQLIKEELLQLSKKKGALNQLKKFQQQLISLTLYKMPFGIAVHIQVNIFLENYLYV